MTIEPLPVPSLPSHRVRRWVNRVGLAQKLAWGLAAAALVSALVSYLVMTDAAPFIPRNPTNVLILLNVDLVFLLLLAAVIARRVVELWVDRRRRLAGSRLHVRLVFLFSVVATVPTILVAVFSVLFFHFGLQGWFSQRVRTALTESIAVAQAYMREHQQVIAGDTLAMANDINRSGPSLLANPARLQRVIETQTVFRGLPEAVIFDSGGNIVARSGLTYRLEFETVPDWALDEARRGGVAVLVNETEDRIRALVRLDEIGDLFLYVGRYVERRVLNHLDRVRDAVSDYERLEGQRGDIEVTFGLIFAMISLLFLLVAVWVGVALAQRLARPVSELVEAAERVRAGDLTVRVQDASDADELGTLSRAFNRMTNQLGTQRAELIDANRQLDERRRFTEAVLSGVAAGVIGVDQDGRLNLPNRTASDLLGLDLERCIGQPLGDVVPELADIVADALTRPGELVESQVPIVIDSQARTLLVRAASEAPDISGDGGGVVTFTDITELLSAQRKAAWGDVARRIAHEIKNPLTPIQLSAERLKRRYLAEIESDPQTFALCTDTIVRQVEDLRRMVDEFSDFARMPAPVMRPCDLAKLIEQAVVLQRHAHAAIRYRLRLPSAPVLLDCDARQVGQALTNLLTNAAEAIEARRVRDGAAGKGLAAGESEINLALWVEDRAIKIVTDDTGIGLPQQNRDRLTEPYVTTRAKGTGLGLAIVAKIMEDHGGRLLLEDGEFGGARVTLVFPTGSRRQTSAATDVTLGEPLKTHAHGA
ncbi:MAG: PAS domain-containing sensor histidine kinase [Alphaproteobacteria bacterium]|nr:PAS domain-containing sensor histidine kinase [Alphaproteobacteria bacterium]